MSLWFAFERWIYNWHDGQKLLSDALRDASQNVLDTHAVTWSTSQVRRGYTIGRKLLRVFGRTIRAIAPGIAFWKSSPGSSTTVTDPEAPLDALEVLLSMAVQNTHSRNSTDETVKRPPLRGRERFIDLVNRIIEMQKASARRPMPYRGTRATRRQITRSSDLGGIVPSARVNQVVPKLKDLIVALQRDYHNGLVRDIQFSPDGKFLATSG